MAVEEKAVIKYGIIGVGMMGREHLLNLYHLRDEGVEVVCIADPHIPSQQQAYRLSLSFQWPIQIFSGHKALLDSGLCDVLIVSTPNMTHHEILMDILNHPKPYHVLVEKPLCTSVEHCKEVMEVAGRLKPDMLVQVGLEYRYMPPVAKLAEIVKGGSLGQVKMVSIREHRFPFLVKVPDIIDNAYVIVEFENGSRGMLDLCMFAEGSKNEQEISVTGDIGKGEAFIPESIVRWGIREEGRAGVQTINTKDDRIKYNGLHHGSSYLEHLHFLSAIREKGARAPSVSLYDGLISVAMGVASQLSIEKGRFIAINEILK
ncbi:unnamed protein product [Cuscuta europaea]|uniref:Gfo/Idh/MocA-like oxidoreductase N-terminal domain-containing protein n=1 Tax=Cuscuta europaea TaxID=41803 RepID=A0A9P0Z4V1_CUSEU|nr:unnamed protein product [Cuscuta europaea]